MKKLLPFVAAILILAAAAIFLLDVRLMTSQSQASANTASSRTGDPDAPWNFAPQATGLYVEGSGRLAQNLQARLTTQLRNQAHIGQVTAIKAPAGRLDLPVLYAEILPQSYFWTPFYAAAEYRLVVSYASDGNISFREQDAPHFVTDASQPTRQFHAICTFQDASAGFITAPGYQAYLAEKMSALVQETVEKQLE